MTKLMSGEEMEHRLALLALDLTIEKWGAIAEQRKELPDKKTDRWDIGIYTCALCRLFHKETIEGSCEDCPYFVFYGFACDSPSPSGHWQIFAESQTMENALAMRDALQAIKDWLGVFDE